MANCDVNRIHQFLSHELSPAELRELEQHLESCDICCRRLEDTAADAETWAEASRFLPDESDDLHRVTEVATRPEMVEHDDLSSSAIPAAIQNVIGVLAPTDDPQMLGRIGNYEIAGAVGAGGMSVVLKAFDSTLNRYVAIKVLAPHLATSGAARKRFAREAQAAAAIVHDNVIAIHGVDEAKGLPYLVMPYVKGDSLQKRINDEGPLELKEVLRIAKQTAAGLAAAHAQGLVHRDVKPANILLADGVERVTITDFGLARAADDASLTVSGTIAGTPQYMSPEQARGETVDQRSDLFSLGSVIYAMCTGRAPFRADSSLGVLRRISDARPRPIHEVNADIPPWMCKLVERLHAKAPEDRYSSALAVEEDLEQCLAHVQQPSRESLPHALTTSVPRQFFAKHWQTTISLFVAVLFVIVVLTLPALREAPSGPSGSTNEDAVASPTPPVAEERDRVVASPTPPSGPTHDETDLDDWFDGTDRELLELEIATRWIESQLALPPGGSDTSPPSDSF